MKFFKVLTASALAMALMMASGCDKQFDPWDNLGGGGEATDVVTSADEIAEDYFEEEIATAPNTDDIYGESNENRYEIDLDEVSSADLSSVTAYSYKNNELKIKTGGVFVLSGSFVGCVTVEDTDGAVQLLLDNVEIQTAESQDSAAIVFKKPSGEAVSDRIITVKEGTVNTLSDSVGDNEDGDGAVISAKKRGLKINGLGTLSLNCRGAETSGIKAKTDITIDETTVVVYNSNKSGIKADETVVIRNANITVNSNGDGIKTDIEPETADEAALYASNPKYGYLYIENSNLDITAGDDGISANNCLYIANTDEKLIKITTNGGAPSYITEASSDAADGKAIKTDGVGFEDEVVAASYEQNYGLVITGGVFEINSNDDALSSKGNLVIEGGSFAISSGDDGVHAEYLTKITGGDLTVSNSYEAVEGATVEITGGTLQLKSTDDGINAANSDLVNYSYYILIAGGDITVDAGGDGIDSNGTVKITGGNIWIFGPTSGENAALDADTGVIVTGGNLCAFGPSGMIETPSGNSTQCYISLVLPTAASANTAFTVTDSQGSVLYSVTPNKKYQSVVVSLELFEIGESYSVTVGNESYTAKFSSVGVALGNDRHGQGNQGLRPHR